TIKDFVRNLNHEKQKQAVIRFETNPGIQAQVDWKESLKFKTQDGDMIKFNVFLLILGFSRTKFLCVTETRDLHTVEECLVKATAVASARCEVEQPWEMSLERIAEMEKELSLIVESITE
ncbi:MAG: hypothetical protein UIH18_01300, partial [Fibrobacteraceae bacterium]|nr:hypothetical protein [Fibrobacteraceae bacterium]